ncbi:DUF935 family protein [Polymorphospora lycopeni]|uniref:DUF935 family protein n=1 Tax=Polymorphospora lycopeni TaxID=3140240 RepID=A0ABV5CLC2_9ACTN
MARTSAPTRLIGQVSEWTGVDAVFDPLEHVPPLLWPQSVRVYGEMRRDPRLAAILTGYTLQLRRATWQVDGTGCRPEVVQHVADDLGLPMMDAEDPGVGRYHGVSWSEHLRAALLMLPFGHMGFEMEAAIVDGRARLTTLAERLPVTIDNIHVDTKTGRLLGVDQQLTSPHGGTPQIRADRLAWYCHEREGATWTGTSLLRPAYGPWLLKHELMRVHAQANRRWGMGVPVMEAKPGTQPTVAQMQEAMTLAAAARGGDQAGAAVPPGFELKIVGMSGSVPDTLAYIKWLDQQMSQMALMNHLDLGTSESGSRALGTAFIDSWTLALGSIADEIADVATRQIAARIVEWNWGDQEPVPRVVASGIGSKREVTAESLQLLLSSGALSGDPALEEWVRREWRLPERESAAPARTATRGAPGQPTGGEPERVAAAEPAMVEPDYEQIRDQHDQAVREMAAQWEEQSGPLVEALAAATAAEVAAGTLVGLGMLAVSPALVAALAGGLAIGLSGVAAAAATGAAAELAAGGVTVRAELGADRRQRVRALAEATAGLIVGGYSSAAGRTALRLSGPDATAEAVAEAVRADLTELSRAKDGGLVAGQLRSAASAAQGEGRLAALEQAPDGTRFRATERLDANSCGPCRKADGAEYATLAAGLTDYPLGLKNRHCQGRDRCRGFLVPLLPIMRR